MEHKDIMMPDDDTDLDRAENAGAMMGYRVKDAAEAGIAPLSIWAATRPELPTWARVGFGVIGAVKAPGFLRRVKRWVKKS